MSWPHTVELTPQTTHWQGYLINCLLDRRLMKFSTFVSGKEDISQCLPVMSESNTPQWSVCFLRHWLRHIARRASLLHFQLFNIKVALVASFMTMIDSGTFWLVSEWGKYLLRPPRWTPWRPNSPSASRELGGVPNPGLVKFFISIYEPANCTSFKKKPGLFVWFSTFQSGRFGRESVSHSIQKKQTGRNVST